MTKPARSYWLMKTEPEVYSIDTLAQKGRGSWDGVRNYQARNHMRAMKAGDLVLFYHSSTEPPGVAGIARVCREAYPDPTQFDPEDHHYDAKRAREELGFLRMWSIYPAQVQPIVDAMAPDFREVQRGAEILLAAQAASWGPIQHAGDLHDRATYRYFWELLQRAKLSGLKVPEDADKAFFG